MQLSRQYESAFIFWKYFQALPILLLKSFFQIDLVIFFFPKTSFYRQSLENAWNKSQVPFMEIGIITQKFITFDSEQTYLFLFSCLFILF